MKDLPPINLKSVKFLQTVAAEGSWHALDRWADGQLIIADGKYRMCAFTNQFGGGVYSDKVYDRDAMSRWPALDGGLLDPTITIAKGTNENNGAHVDTFTIGQNPLTKLFTCLYTARPGTLPPGESGWVHSIQRATAVNPSQDPSSWTRYGGENILVADPLVAWMWPNPLEPGHREGGLYEISFLFDLDIGKVVMFPLAQNLEEPDPFGILYRGRLGRAECPIEFWDTDPVSNTVWTPTPAADSWVWDPVSDGAGGAYSSTVPGIWGTAWFDHHPHVSVDPDGVYHLVGMGKNPNPGGGFVAREASTGIGHWYSEGKGVKGSWIPDRNNPLIVYDDIGFSVENEKYNKLNSPHLVWDGPTPYLGFWGGDEGVRVVPSEYYYFSFEATMACPACKNTTVTLENITTVVTSGKITPTRATVATAVKAYREPRGIDQRRTELSKAARRQLFVIPKVTGLGPETIITDEGDSREYRIDDFNEFTDHVEIVAVENLSND